MTRFVWLGILWPLVLVPFLHDPTPVRDSSTIVRESSTDTTYADGRYVAIVPVVQDTNIVGTDTFVRLRPDPDSIGSGKRFRAVRKPSGDSFLVISYDTLVKAALDSAAVDSIWSDWGLGTPLAYGVSVPGSPSISYPNEPSGLTDTTERRFSARDEAGWGYLDDPKYAIQLDTSAPHTPDSVGTAIYPTGFSGGSGPISTSYYTSAWDSDTLYTAYWVKISSNWQCHTSGVNKIHHIWAIGSPSYGHDSGYNFLYHNIWCTPTGGDPVFQLRLQGLEADQTSSRNLSANLGSATMLKGQWYFVEVLQILNTPGSADGELHAWIDGTKTHAYTDVGFVAADATPEWYRVQWNPTWGGTGDTVADTMYMWIDHIRASGN